jgi:hypothetical protein
LFLHGGEVVRAAEGFCVELNLGILGRLAAAAQH